MLHNYIKIAFRNIIRHKAYSFLNISGLAIGMACSIFILLWVQNELSYDRSHKDADLLYRLTCSLEDFKAAVSPAGMAEELEDVMPEIKATVRVSKVKKRLFEVNNLKFEEKMVYDVDSNFLQVFNFPLVSGDPATALSRPDVVIINESTAKKYFGEKNALGKKMRVGNDRYVTVTGIVSDKNPNSHLKFDFIMPMTFIASYDNDLITKTWGNFNFYTYIQLNENVNVSALNISTLTKRIDDIYIKHNSDGIKPKFKLQPVQDIHLYSDMQIDVSGHGNIQYVKIFFIVALFILAVACINFMNLATARSARRAKEVGLRKVVGAGRRQLIFQFLGESMLIAFISLILAVCLVWLLLPAFNSLSGKELNLKLFDSTLLFTLLGIALVTGLISGSYPAMFLSGFKPISILKGKLKTGAGDLAFRNSLVVIQFMVSILLLSGTAIVYKQLNFIMEKNVGFDKANLLYMPMNDDLHENRELLKNLLRDNSLTSNFSIVSNLPTNLTTGDTGVYWEGKTPNSDVVIPSIHVDESFVKVFQTKIISGRGFSEEFKGDSSNFVVNETAVKVMGMTVDNAVGKQVDWDDRRGTIVGVVQDFNFKPLQYTIEPLFLLKNRGGGIVVIRTQSSKTAATIEALKAINTRLNPSYPFTFNFLEQDLADQYQGEQQMGKVFNLFAILAIVISCLGLYGLSAFTAEQRTREIGVRKVLGASVGSIVYLLSGKFTKLIIIAMVIAIPISWYAIDSWLQSFAYRVEISWVVFVGASLGALLIAWLTVSYESVKAAVMNPVRSLRSE